MLSGEPSRTALGAARLRAAHQVLERGRIFSDPLAVRILGPDAAPLAPEADDTDARRRLRLFVAARARFAEDALATMVSEGPCQLVVLGAGLDTYAYRSPFADRLPVFEVDHPETQAWKRQRLAEAAIPIPETLTFAPVDFERGTLAAGLAAVGFDATRRTFFAWLGVVPYLTEPAVLATLGFVASLEGGARVVFDYTAAATKEGESRVAHEALAARVAAAGEPFESDFEPEPLGVVLRAFGFRALEDVSGADLVARYLPGRARSGRPSTAHVMNAAKD